jgi:hypothetical protein
MAKRFTDTAKWKKEFIKGLSAKHKLLWFYILDDCDHAGVWEVDFEVACLRIGETIIPSEALEALSEQVTIIAKNRWWIKDFVTFQYGELTPRNKMYQPIMTTLKKYNIQYPIPHISPIDGVKVKDKEKVIVKEEEKGVEFSYEVQTEPNAPIKLTAKIPASSQPDFSDYERWTKDVIDGNDQYFPTMLKNEGLQINGAVKDYAKTFLGLLAQYPKKAPPDQHRFRVALVGHISENINKTNYGQRNNTKGGNGKMGPETGKDYSGGF